MGTGREASLKYLKTTGLEEARKIEQKLKLSLLVAQSSDEIALYSAGRDRLQEGILKAGLSAIRIILEGCSIFPRHTEESVYVL